MCTCYFKGVFKSVLINVNKMGRAMAIFYLMLKIGRCIKVNALVHIRGIVQEETQ